MDKGDSVGYDQVLNYIVGALRDTLGRVPREIRADVLEIRIRQARPLALVTVTGILFVTASGKPTTKPSEGYQVTLEDCRLTLQAMTRSSVYMVEDKLLQGFLTLPGGHRVGLAGTGYVEGGELRALREVGQFNIRIARQLPGVATPVMPSLVEPDGRFLSTLVISPPGCGKTTLIRDIARQLSWGKSGFWPRHTVTIVDERSEIAATWQGEPQTDTGPCTDILDGYPKTVGILIAIRALAPDVLVTDELGGSADVAAIIEAGAAGIAVLASIHGDSWENVQKRPGGKELAQSHLFRRLVVLSQRQGPGTLEKVLLL
ncbi:MAG: stage III sporulation protein AA [Firmicutes bacterium]|jgi:stage III sporulation protein AA|nr:stage III sporulation protein AA [Bacillota bacterium]